MSIQITGSYPRTTPDPRAHDYVASRAAVSATRASEPDSGQPLQSDIRETLQRLERLVTQFNRRFEFVVDEQINRVIVKVIDKETDKVIKEIPPQEIQHLLARLRETMGLLVDEEI